jgi:hypothetical protein
MLILFCWHALYPCIFSRNANQSLAKQVLNLHCYNYCSDHNAMQPGLYSYHKFFKKKVPEKSAFVRLGKMKHLYRKNKEKTFCFGHVKKMSGRKWKIMQTESSYK